MSYNGMDNGSYDGFSSSQMGGGGNFASPSQGTMNQYGAGSGGKPQQKRDPQTLVPVTMKMALEASEQNGKLFISGHQVSQVRILVNPLSVQLNETNVTITGEDGTGSMTAKIYTDNSNDAPQIPEGQYSMMVGKIVKGNSGQVTMTAFTSRVVDDPNEVTAHFLDCIHTHLRFTQGPRLAAGGAAAPGGMMMANGAAAGGYMKHEAAPAAHYGGGGMGHSELPPGMPSTGDTIRDQVLAAFATGPEAMTDGGCSVSSVVAHLSHLTFHQVQEAIQMLSNDGHLYSTIDEEHYKTTSA